MIARPSPLWCALLLLGCGTGDAPPGVPEAVPGESLHESAGRPAEPFDLPAIRERGSLRVLVSRSDAGEHLPRSGWPPNRERDLAEALATELGLELEWVTVDAFDELLPALVAGVGDLVVDNLTVTPERRRQVAFSTPVTFTREQIVSRTHEEGLAGPADLDGRTVVVRQSSSYWSTLQTLRQEHPGIIAVAAPEELAVDEILLRVAEGSYDLTIADSNLVRPVLAYREDLRVAFELERVAVIAWAMRHDARSLREAVDAYLTRVSAATETPPIHMDDLPGIRKHGTLRVLTRNNAANYYVWNGQLVGFEYDLVRDFAKQLDLRLEMIVPPTHDDLLPWLRAGRGDLVAASLTASDERAEEAGIVFSRRTNRVREMIVARADDPIASVEALAGRRVHVRRGSHYWRTLAALRESGVSLELVATPHESETEEIIQRVAFGEYDLTLADEHIVDIELHWRDDVRAAFALGDPVDHGWAVRRDNPKLLEAVDAWVRRTYRSTLYNVLAKRYFGEPKRIRRHAEARVQRSGRISPYDETVKRYSEHYGFDWRLIAAQMYQESRFDPTALSAAGARGLMQVMPRTARELGLDHPEDPEQGIHAGIRYLSWMRERFDEELPGGERTWLALAAYNVGYGHVRDARRLAPEYGLDPDRWFGHVENAILQKRKRDVAQRTRFGYCRCDEPVRYVRAIRDRYRAYVRAAAGLPVSDVTTDWMPRFTRQGAYGRPPS